jgi:site-specific recombinase XerD
MERTTSVAKVQMVVLPDGERTWTVLGSDHLPLAPVEEFLEHHRVVGSSPNTVRSYAYGLGLWWRYLTASGTAWDDPRVSTVTGFVSWLRAGGGDAPGSVIQLPSVRADTAALSDASIQIRLAAVGSFYRYHDAASGVPFPGVRGGPRSRYRPFMAHLAGRRAPRPVLARLKRPVPGPAPTLTPEQVGLILGCCARRDDAGEWEGSLRDRLLFELLAESGLRLGEALGLRHADWTAGRGDTPFVEVVPREHPHGVRVKGMRSRRVFISDRLERLYGEYVWRVSDAAWADGRELEDDWYVFVNLAREPRFRPLRPESVYETVRRSKRQLGDASRAGGRRTGFATRTRPRCCWRARRCMWSAAGSGTVMCRPRRTCTRG